MIFDVEKIQNFYLGEAARYGEGYYGVPCLTCICGKDDASLSFIKALQSKSTESKVRINTIMLSCSDYWENTITLLNKSEYTSGILLISPPDNMLYGLIMDSKNVEGNDFDDRIDRVSCTAQAIVKIASEMIKDKFGEWKDKNSELLRISDYIKGFRVAILGYGKAVGKPLSYLFMRQHAGYVTTLHKYTSTSDARKILCEADIIVTATGKPGVFESIAPPELLEEKYIIDAGISMLNGSIVGDIDAEQYSINNNMITKVPGGVGAVTTAMILYNTALAAHGRLV